MPLSLNNDAGQCQAYAPPAGEVTTLTLTAAAGTTLPAGVRIVVGADAADLTPTPLGTVSLSPDATVATWALSEADCAVLRAHRYLRVQVPSGTTWKGVLAGYIRTASMWTGSRSVQSMGTVVVGPQGPPGAFIVDTSDPEGVTLTLAEGANITANSDAEGVTLTTT